MAMFSSSRKLILGALAVVQLSLAATVGLSTAAPAQEAKADRPHIDLAFCIDTTGSMQHEIDNVKKKTKEIVAKLAGGHPAPVVRVGLVAFRDRGDEYVTKVFPFTDDIDKMVKDISNLKADGGGDTLEAVNQAMHASVNDLKWSDDKKTLKLLFLIGDAGPNQYPGDFNWKDEAKAAIGKGIQINTIGCQGLENLPATQGVEVWKQIAQLSDGKYESLSYRHEVAQADGTRATIVSSGGAMYKLDAKSADWREGAATLASKGKAARVDSLTAVAGARMGLRARGLMMARPAMAGAGAAGGAAMEAAAAPIASSAYSSLSARDENNLADLVLSATREAAKKRLNVDFKEK